MSSWTTEHMGGGTSSIHTKKFEIQRACFANLCATLLPSLYTKKTSIKSNIIQQQTIRGKINAILDHCRNQYQRVKLQNASVKSQLNGKGQRCGSCHGLNLQSRV